MYYVYILKDERKDRLYIGYTEDLRRLIEYEKNDDSIELIYYEAYIHGKQTRVRERKLLSNKIIKSRMMVLKICPFQT